MRIVKTIEEYQECIEEVKKTRQAIIVKSDLDEEEFKKREDLKMEGVQIMVGKVFDEIKPSN